MRFNSKAMGVVQPADGRRAATPSLRDQAYERVKGLILTGELRPGEYVNESEIADELGFGRTPINQAMHRLSLENFVVIMPRKGGYVKPLSMDELLLIVEARRLNECYAAKLAARCREAEHLTQMAAGLERAASAAIAGDTQVFLAEDRAFHGQIARACGNVILANILHQLHEQALRYWYVSLETNGQTDAVQHQHEAIYHAIKAQDEDVAAAAMAAHIDDLLKNLSKRV